MVLLRFVNTENKNIIVKNVVVLEFVNMGNKKLIVENVAVPHFVPMETENNIVKNVILTNYALSMVILYSHAENVKKKYRQTPSKWWN